MRAARATEPIDVQALRVGMFVHLDVGWMSHPFPLSSFRIASEAQLETIRGLGVARVRWSPEQSAIEAAVQEAEAAETVAAALDGVADGDGDDAAPAPPVSPQARRLAAQREALARVERQYGEAARACRQTLEMVADRPQEARGVTEALTRALVEKMLGEQDLCIRMVAEGAGEKATSHAMNVAIVSLLMGRCFGFADEEMLDLGVGAMLHDVGKLDLPQSMRHCEPSFSPSETRVYREHVELGVAQARRMGLRAGAAAVVAQHHEAADASGFPAQLDSDRMTMAARIVALVNRFDNLCNPHQLARALTPHEALSLLFAQEQSRFDTSILGAFIKMMGVYPPGSVVQLTDDRWALVVSVNSTRPLKPNVLVHDPAVPRDDALLLDLQRAGGIGIRRSVRAQQLPPPALDYLKPDGRVAYFFEPSAPAEEDA